MITNVPCGSFHGFVRISADSGPVESWEDVQTSGLLNCVSKRGVSGMIVHFVGENFQVSHQRKNSADT